MFTLRMLVAASVCGAAVNLATSAAAADIVEVEETWSFVVGEPDTSKNSPQVSTTMGPLNTTSDLHFVFTLNHVNSPDYSPGGLQVQVWNDEQLLSYKTGPARGALSHNNETVRWTQKLSVVNGAVTFEVVDGSSNSWGQFGGQGYLKTTESTSLANLNDYRPRLSLTESGVGYGGNRVGSFELERIRWTMSDGAVYQYLAPIDIDADLDP